MQIVVHALVLAYQRDGDFCLRPAAWRPIRNCAGFFLRFWSVLLGMPRRSRAQTPLRVAAAADLEPVLPPILEQFQQATGIHAEATYQASAMLTTQIQNGAPSICFCRPI